MNVDMQIRYSINDKENNIHVDWLCFKHAVKRATLGQNIEVDIDDYNDSHYMGSTICEDCSEED